MHTGQYGKISHTPRDPSVSQPGFALDDADSTSTHSIEAGIEQERNASAPPHGRRVLKKMASDVTDAKMSVFYARQARVRFVGLKWKEVWLKLVLQ